MPNEASSKLESSLSIRVHSWTLGDLLDELMLQQQINANLVLHAITNYKKTPLKRKTVGFIDRKMQKVQFLWRDFRRCHKQIRQDFKNVLPQHGYFQQELYGLVRAKYMTARSRMSCDKRNLLKCKVNNVEQVS